MESSTGLFEILAIIATALLAGGLFSMPLLLTLYRQLLASVSGLTQMINGFLWLNAGLAISGGFASALSRHPDAGFLLGIIGMGLILSRIHLMRLALRNLAEGQRGDPGARRMFIVLASLLAGLLTAQWLASLWALLLLTGHISPALAIL
jgi:hypothetical protein